MAHIIYRKFGQPSHKKNWIPPNRKYKYLFWVSFSLNIIIPLLWYFNK